MDYGPEGTAREGASSTRRIRGRKQALRPKTASPAILVSTAVESSYTTDEGEVSCALVVQHQDFHHRVHLNQGERHDTGNSRAANEARIRERLEDWAKAVRAKDIERVISHYAPDILLFDLAPPLQYRGADSCRKNWAEWFSHVPGPGGLRDSRVEHHLG